MAGTSTTKAGPKRPEWLVQFGRRLMLARGRAGLTQQGLGAPNLSKSFISLLESGRSHPSVETVIALAERLSTSIASLFLDPPELRRETALNLLRLASDTDLSARADEALKIVDAAEALVPDLPADLRVRAALVRARAAIATGKIGEGTQWAAKAATIASRQRLNNFVGMALALRGTAEYLRGASAKAAPILEQATETLRRAKAARTEENVRALLSLGAAWIYLGHVGRAQRAYRRALEIATRLRLEGMRGRALTGLGLVERTRGRLDSAVRHLSDASEAFAGVEELQERARTLTNLGLVYRDQSQFGKALVALQQALRIRERLGDPLGRSMTLAPTSEVLLALGRTAEAARAARRAMKDAQSAGNRAREGAAQVTLARVLRAQGRRREAIELLRGATSTLKRLALHSLASSASGELAVMLREIGANAEAGRFLSRAMARGRRFSSTTIQEAEFEGLLG